MNWNSVKKKSKEVWMLNMTKWLQPAKCYIGKILNILGSRNLLKQETRDMLIKINQITYNFKQTCKKMKSEDGVILTNEECIIECSISDCQKLIVIEQTETLTESYIKRSATALRN